MIEVEENFEDLSKNYNLYSDLNELVCGVLLGGTNKILCHKKYSLFKGTIKKTNELFISEYVFYLIN